MLELSKHSNSFINDFSFDLKKEEEINCLDSTISLDFNKNESY